MVFPFEIQANLPTFASLFRGSVLNPANLLIFRIENQ